MKYILFLFILILPRIVLCQNDNLVKQQWCFEKNFHHALSLGDTLVVNSFVMDNSPIQFKENGKFKRIKAPVRMCGNSPNPKTIDNLKGTWKINQNRLSMVFDNKHILFIISKLDQQKLVIIVERIS